MAQGSKEIAVIFRVKSNPRWKHIVYYSEELKEVVRKWRLAARNRHRWLGRDVEHIEEVQKDFRIGMKIGLPQLKIIGQCGVVEVTIPNPDKESGIYAPMFPWEYALSVATRKIRAKTKRLTVIRSTDKGRLPRGKVNKILYLECIPPELERLYSFKHERYLVDWYAAQKHRKSDASFANLLNVKKLIGADANRANVLKTIRDFEPDIIHVAGFDISDANTRIMSLLNTSDIGKVNDKYARNIDGVYMKSGTKFRAFGKKEIAELLTSATKKPKLICLNIYHSATRLAPAMLQEGAGAVISFYGTFEDSLAEQFYEKFYTSFRSNHFGELTNSFESAYRALKENNRYLRGSAIVLWNQKSFLKYPSWPNPRNDISLEADFTDEIQSVSDAKRLLELDVLPISNLNYSVLHNPMKGRGQLFEHFRIVNHSTSALRVFVEVELHVGSDNFPFRHVVEVLAHSFRDITEEIKVPLTSELARQVRESVRTSLHSRISIQGSDRDITVFEHTYPITLLPANEWRDDEENMVWLPSFVMPRDPQISNIVDLSLKYLQTLTDDPTAGFEAYANVRSSRYKKDRKIIEDQVRAIWSCLQFEFNIGYTTPPPTYTHQSQRLRTPTQVIGNRLGTCIDFSLLVAACLEYIGIKPTIFLFDGHANVGFWNVETSQKRYAAATGYEPSEDSFNWKGVDLYDTPDVGPLPQNIDESWIAKNRSEIKQYLNDGVLSALETTYISNNAGFNDALEAGYRSLLTPEFECMIDISLAREKGVTPLPLLNEDVS